MFLWLAGWNHMPIPRQEHCYPKGWMVLNWQNQLVPNKGISLSTWIRSMILHSYSHDKGGQYQACNPETHRSFPLPFNGARSKLIPLWDLFCTAKTGEFSWIDIHLLAPCLADLQGDVTFILVASLTMSFTVSLPGGRKNNFPARLHWYMIKSTLLKWNTTVYTQEVVSVVIAHSPRLRREGLYFLLFKTQTPAWLGRSLQVG